MYVYYVFSLIANAVCRREHLCTGTDMYVNCILTCWWTNTPEVVIVVITYFYLSSFTY